MQACIQRVCVFGLNACLDRKNPEHSPPICQALLDLALGSLSQVLWPLGPGRASGPLGALKVREDAPELLGHPTDSLAALLGVGLRVPRLPACC